MVNTTNNPPLIILRYPGQRAGEYSYAVLRPSDGDAEVYELASSWFGDVGQAKDELKRMRERVRGRERWARQ